MTPEQKQRIEQIRERRAGISPSSWQHKGPTDNEERKGEMRQYVTRTVGCGDVPPEKFVITILNCGNDVARDVADAEFIAAAPDDIDFLLALVKSQEAPRTASLLRRLKDFLFENCDHAERDRNYDWCPSCVMAFMDVVAIPSDSDAATSMRSACIEKVRAIRDKAQKYEEHDQRDPLRSHLHSKFLAAKEIIEALESVSLQEEK